MFENTKLSNREKLIVKLQDINDLERRISEVDGMKAELVRLKSEAVELMEKERNNLVLEEAI